MEGGLEGPRPSKEIRFFLLNVIYDSECMLKVVYNEEIKEHLQIKNVFVSSRVIYNSKCQSGKFGWMAE